MDTTRFVMGVLLVVAAPPAIVFWLLIHPFAGFWQRVGLRITYSFGGAFFVFLCAVLFRFRSQILGPDLGLNGLLATLGLGLYAVSAWISIITRRTLDTKTFTGVPEISGDASEGALLQEGIYGVIRHPRYVSVVIGLTGFALVVNYLGAYLVVLGCVPALLLVVFLEERELEDRFGQAYRVYSSRVPRFFPRF